MLDVKTAATIKNSIDKKTHPLTVNLEDVCRMEPLPIAAVGPSITVLGMQYRHLSILVWVEFDEKLGIIVHRVEDLIW